MFAPRDAYLLMSTHDHSHRAANVVVTRAQIASSIPACIRPPVSKAPRHICARTGTGIHYRTPQRHCSYLAAAA
ncbi:hypothetical protein XFF6166_610116 [Xanthomonas citri pv. fuscans]|uniref:Uncharacterized protein n=1 Tax=Xanthomonas campestris pv. phaseoli TaxID=317013 RepID=A0A7Z7IZ05_XANCH|nr:hypothetical protein XFF6166_610116 [Xanthomonas citri pv. fuscans]SOO24217.1 hypothetical protein XFF6991_340016 [Xanthomonas phaseoli pv. phaseoli]SON97407.1 hypothetical protein XFF6990_450038 [Xanthomonas citri pv. fuscans]SON99390.1 hypothetical protein XFF6960_170037 [Xanthomonas citri pv. fuscans]SOO07173.1 hypothetical protein XFF7767_900092 [Xanthomonas citri pv. fuscans]